MMADKARTVLIGLVGLVIVSPIVYAAPGAVAPASAETPEAFIRRVYALYRTGDSPGVSMARPDGAPYYTATLLDAFTKDEELAHGEVGAIDWDPLCGCQERGDLRVENLAIAKSEGHTVEARVGIFDLGTHTKINLTLSQTPTGWRIADIGDKDHGTSVLKLLQDAIAHPIHEMPPSDPDPLSPNR